MRVRILYFAAVRELVGLEEEEVVLPSAVSTVGAFTEWVQSAHSALKGRLNAVRIARNEQFAGPTTPIAEGDTLALIPPVAGG